MLYNDVEHRAGHAVGHREMVLDITAAVPEQRRFEGLSVDELGEPPPAPSPAAFYLLVAPCNSRAVVIGPPPLTRGLIDFHFS